MHVYIIMYIVALRMAVSLSVTPSDVNFEFSPDDASDLTADSDLETEGNTKYIIIKLMRKYLLL